jgi:hypothetical protein
MWFDGRKFTNNGRPKYFATLARATSVRNQLKNKFAILADYKISIEAPRRKNPESREQGLADSAALLEKFSGYPARKVLEVTPRSTAKTGLVVGEMDYIDYIAKREGINGSQKTRYRHQFSKHSRPLLAVTQDGKQLHIVGGRYEFTEAGIEDR